MSELCSGVVAVETICGHQQPDAVWAAPSIPRDVFLVQAVGPRLNGYFDRPWQAQDRRGTRLVVIGEKHMDRPAIEASLRG